MPSSFSRFLVDRDIYGEKIKVMYKGNDLYQTKLGALCTILTYVLICINAFSVFQGFVNGTRQNESAQTLYFDRYEAGPISLPLSSFDVKISTLV